MAKVTQAGLGKLTDGVYTVEPGLYLRVRGKYRNFFVRLQVSGKRREVGIGSAKDITLARARVRAAELRAEALSGVTDWGKEEEERRVPTFEAYALEVLPKVAEARRWKSKEKRLKDFTHLLERVAFPAIGTKTVDEITRDDVLGVLAPIWETQTTRADLARSLIYTVLDYAAAEGWTEKRNPAEWKGGLSIYLPPPSKVHQHKHHEAPTLEEAQRTARAFIRSSYASYRAVAFVLLTATRVSEAVNTEWKEIDLEAAVWTIPPERRKDGKPEPFRVPLSTQAVAFLKSIKREGDRYLFAGPTGKPVLRHRPREAIARYLERPVTVHGCRSTFRDWCARTGKDHFLAERCLMHAVGGEVFQAYQRDDLLEQRRPIMQAWADALFEDSKIIFD